MSKKQIFVIGESIFGSKKEIQEYTQAILNGYALGETLNEADLGFVCELLKRHPRYNEKVGSGIESVQIRMDDEWGKTRQFLIVRQDGSSTDFSYLKCLKGAPEDSLLLFKASARSAIKNQIIDFREHHFQQNQNKAGEVACQATGYFVNRQTCHVDHHPNSFDSLVDAFIAERHINVDTIQYTGFGDGEQRKAFSDVGLAESFSRFHKEHACLRIIGVKANLTKKKR